VPRASLALAITATLAAFVGCSSGEQHATPITHAAATHTRWVHVRAATPKPDRGAYGVVEHWDIECGGLGGFGEKVIVRSHRVSDLKAAFDKFIETTPTGGNRCVVFDAYTDERAHAIEHMTDPTPAQGDYELSHSLNYMNNPNGDNGAGSEFYRTPDDQIHCLRGHLETKDGITTCVP
jgi:hypothetical protein